METSASVWTNLLLPAYLCYNGNFLTTVCLPSISQFLPKDPLLREGEGEGEEEMDGGGGWRGVTTKFLLASFCSHRNLVREPLHGRPDLASFVHTLGITLLLPWPLKVIVILMTSHRYVKTLGLAYECF